MPNPENLTVEDRHILTNEDRKKGGQISAQKKKEQKDLRKALEVLLEKKYPGKDGKKMTGTEAVCLKLFEQALKGNVKAFETLRATIGQDPVQKVMVAEVEQSVIDEVEQMVSDTE